MPTHCCVPKSNQKGYKNKKERKGNFFEFPTDETERKKLFHPIDRLGEGLSLNKKKQKFAPFRPSELSLSSMSSMVQEFK